MRLKKWSAVAAFLCVLATQTHAQFPDFKIHVIDNIGRNIGQTSLVDVDKDGDLDYVCGEQASAGGRVWWFEYEAPDKWVRHDIGKGNTDVGGDCYDINGDGWVDFWGGTVLFLNQGDGTFSRHEVGTTHSHDSEFEDIDGDGRMDGLANRDGRGVPPESRDKVGLVWYAIPKDVTAPWIAHRIDSVDNHEVHAGISPHAVGDLNGDDKNDVVTAQAWYENLDGKGTDWKQHKVLDLGEKHQYGIGVRTWVGDMDSDGDNDIVQSEADNPDGRVAWFENDGKGNFTRHLVKDKGEKHDFHSLVVADFNNDGRLDIYSGDGPLAAEPRRFLLWENLGDNEWREHELASGLQCHEAVSGDVDGDGDIDIVTKHWNKGDGHYFLENRLITK